MKPESKSYRHLDNPEEKRFHDAAKQMETSMLSAITLPLNDRGTEPSRYLNEDEEQLVINTLQWLGSPVGQSWLRELGYENKLKPHKPAMNNKDRKYVVRHAKKNYFGTWYMAGENTKDEKIKKECEALGYTLADFYATDGKFLNKILGR